ncbi:HAD family phosphatase [Candidatus Roizmanbacteria bacterium]|nr:HAD family phosphatase [Candidatus Roizmanbacteria bacterium]
MKYRAVIFDLDGTAMHSIPTGIPSIRLIQAIAMHKTIHFSCATGRNWSFAKKAVQSLNLTSPCIISAGTQIINPQTEKILWQKTIEKNDVKRVLKVIQHYSYHVDINDELPDSTRVRKDCAFEKPLYLINIKTVPKGASDVLCKKINNILGMICIKAISQTKGYFDLHITHKDATKENAVNKFRLLLGLEKKDTIGIGDGHNDIHLFNAVGFKIAMGNAVLELKDQANLVIDTVNNDGLARFIEGLH